MSHQLDHENIVTLYAMVFEQFHYGVVLEFVALGTLEDFTQKFQVRESTLFASRNPHISA